MTAERGSCRSQLPPAEPVQPGRATISQMLTAAAEIAQAQPEPSEAPSTSDARRRKPTKKAAVSSSLTEVKMEKTKIECHITKYPTAIRMRKLHLDSRSLGCNRKDATVEKLKPSHVYNAASPEMPEPKEKRFESEYSETMQPDNKTPFEDLPFMEKSKCWSTQFSCRIRVTDGISLERLLKKLDRSQFTRSDYQTVVDPRVLAKGTLDLYSGTKTEDYRQAFDVRPRMYENEMLNAFGIRPLAVQVDAALAYFEQQGFQLLERMRISRLHQKARTHLQSDVEDATW